jgi:uncharacterized coiled-coil protein SlyX
MSTPEPDFYEDALRRIAALEATLAQREKAIAVLEGRLALFTKKRDEVQEAERKRASQHYERFFGRI